MMLTSIVYFIYLFFEVEANITMEPQLIHISLGSTLNSMVVMWSTANNSECVVNYDIYNEFRYSVKGNVSELTKDSKNALSYLYRAELKNLQTNHTYMYRVICELENKLHQSEIFSFKTLSDDKEQSVNLLVYGDMGATSGQKTVPALLDELASGKFQAVFHNGDLGYDLDSESGAVGDNFLRLIQPIASQFPYMTSPGNHELGSDLHHYRHRFSMPGTEWPMPFNKLWYSFDIGPVHFISFSTEVYFIHNQDYTCEQYHWLLEDLQRANENRNTTPWIIAMGHRPMYCSNNNLDDCTPHFWGQWVKRGLEDLFYGMGVDLVIEAHEHSYERLWPVYQSEVVQKSYNNPRASVHVISGAGGNGEGVDWMGRPNLLSAFRADAKSKNSYGRLSVVNRTHLYFDQVNAVTKEVIDNFWLIQEDHGPFIPNIDCSKSIESHKFCTCPPPIHYVSLLIYISVGFVTAVVVSILLCCYSCKCCRSCCCLKCCLCTTGTGSSTYCKGCYKIGIGSGSRPHYGHQILVNIDVEDIQSVNTDIEDLTLYQSTETNNSFETELLLSS